MPYLHARLPVTSGRIVAIVLLCFVLGSSVACSSRDEPDAAVADSAGADRIAFVRDGEVYTIRPDGSDARLVAKEGQLPVWSPGGDRLAFTAPPLARPSVSPGMSAYLDVHVAGADGSRETNVTKGATG